MADRENVSLESALKAQKALRDSAGLGVEQFPIEAFVGMISDEIEQLRSRGKSEDEIAAIIRTNSDIDISGSSITRFYASPEARKAHGG